MFTKASGGSSLKDWNDLAAIGWVGTSASTDARLV